MWVNYVFSYRQHLWVVWYRNYELFSGVHPNDCCMMIPGSYAQMHEDYD